MPECAIHPITYSEGILATVVKKSLAPPREYSGYEYELYHVRKQQNASNRRPVGLRPAGRFLSHFSRCPWPKKFFEKFSKRRSLAGSWRLCQSLVSGKGENHQHPPKKGGEKMDAIGAAETAKGVDAERRLGKLFQAI